jgi:hypothetical protein
MENMMQDDNDTHLAAQQQQEHMQSMLTKESFYFWLFNLPVYSFGVFANGRNGGYSIKVIYLKEHGLPLDSKIEGL